MNDYEQTYSSCPYCSTSFSNQCVDSGNAILVNCLNPNCKGLVEYYENSCPSCGVEFNEEDWDHFLQNADQELVDRIQEFYTYDDPIMLCCNKDWVHCMCDKPVTWDDTRHIPLEIWGNIYDENYDSDCSNCSNHYSEHCPSLCRFIVDFVKDGVIGEPITKCEHFDPDNYGKEYISSKNGELIHLHFEDF